MILFAFKIYFSVDGRLSQRYQEEVSKPRKNIQVFDSCNFLRHLFPHFL